MGACSSVHRHALARPSGAVCLIALAVVLLALVVYTATLHQDVGWADSAELALQADRMGVTHPPGYPLHTWLGKLMILLFARFGGRDPARATHFLSALCTALTAGVLVLLAARLTGDLLASAAAALMFAFLPPIWDAAVITEVYPVGVLCMALALLALFHWRERPTRPRLVAAGLALGLALGAYLPNVLLLPGCAALLISGVSHGAIRPARPRARIGTAALYGVLAGTLGLFILSWSYFRSRSMPPLGTACVPDSLDRFVSFLAGAEYRQTPALAPALALGRLRDLTLTLGRSFLWVGLAVAVVGGVAQWRGDRPAALALAVAFGGEWLFFTVYAATDYGTMVTAPYLIACVWFAHGMATLSRLCLPSPPAVQLGALRRLLAILGAALLAASAAADLCRLGRPGFGRAQSLGLGSGMALLVLSVLLSNAAVALWLRRHTLQLTAFALSSVLVVTLLAGQVRPRLVRSTNGDVSVFVHLSFDMFPPDALVVARWDKLPPLLYYQRTEGLRPDVTVIEPLADWHPLLEQGDRPVLVDEVDPALRARYQFIVRPHGWYLLRRRVPVE